MPSSGVLACLEGDDDARRLVWAVVGSSWLTHHNASMQVFEAARQTRMLRAQAVADIKRTLEEGD